MPVSVRRHRRARPSAREPRAIRHKIFSEGQYYGSLKSLIENREAMETLNFMEDEDEIETRSGKFTVRYIEAVAAGLVPDPKGRYYPWRSR